MIRTVLFSSAVAASPPRPWRGVPALVVLALAALPGLAQETADYFRQNCTSCHTIGGGRLTGPDLKNVTSRQDREWLIRFLMNPQAMINAGDPYARKLVEEARGVVMPTLSGMTRERAGALLDLIEAESKLERSQFAGLQITDRPFTAEEIRQGRMLFLGLTRLKNQGPPCLSCHSLEGVTGIGGGRLGPDLTRVYERLEGRRNLAAWLTAPATPVMQPIFSRHPLTPEEILPLVAALEDSARAAQQRPSPAMLTFFLIGLGAAVLALILFDMAWKSRFRAVRRTLVFESIHRGEK